jgi:uncharacterized radical SAM superfamily protein
LEAKEAMHERLEDAWRIRQANFPPEIEFVYPLDTALISLTGHHCDLDCAHCGGYYLQHMTPIWRADVEGATSCLVSGGCDTSGRVPVTRYLEQIKAIRQGRKMNWHVGLIEEADLLAIAPYTDVVSFDFVGDDATICEVYGLDCTVADYVETYRMLRRHTRVIPHITIGLRGGAIGHEYPAMEKLRKLGVDALVFIVFIPTPGTRYADRQPPSIKAVVNILAKARLRFPDRPLHLGCMRPHGLYRAQLDPLAMRAGVNKIVSPAREAVRLAEELGLSIVQSRECCVF